MKMVAWADLVKSSRVLFMLFPADDGEGIVETLGGRFKAFSLAGSVTMRPSRP